MADQDERDAEQGQNVELSTAAASESRLPAVPRDLRDHLPGLEPERHVTDWGRSERVEGLVDRTIYTFLYHYWFRVAAEGIDNVPSEGGALLVANRASPFPPDAAMIAKAIREEHPRGRPVHFATDRRLQGVPALGMLMTKVGGVADHPANVHRLLFDEEELVLAFPEGSEGASKAISERYRLRRFAPQSVEQAIRARVPIVPVAVLGAAEATPVLARLGVPPRGLRDLPKVLPRVPLAPAIPLPAKFRIRFLEPVATDSLTDAAERDGALTDALARDIRALIQENLLEMVAQRRSVWLG
jgi:1-acyl-sn-glycerol-3-phosphate acyltransferase